MINDSEIFAADGLATVFNGKLIESSANDVESKRKFIGYRLENVKRADIKVICRSSEDSTKIYRATAFLAGVRRKGKSAGGLFFPKRWTKEDVTKAVTEAFESKKLENQADNRYKGKSSCGMEISLWLDGDGKVIDAMPSATLLPRPKRKSPKPKNCKQCGQPKFPVCPVHHNQKKRGFNKLYAVVRRYSRKVYFAFAVRAGLAN